MCVHVYTHICGTQTLTLDLFLSCFLPKFNICLLLLLLLLSWSSLIWLGFLTIKSLLSTHPWLSTDEIRYLFLCHGLYIGNGDPNFGPPALMVPVNFVFK